MDEELDNLDDQVDESLELKAKTEKETKDRSTNTKLLKEIKGVEKAIDKLSKDIKPLSEVKVKGRVSIDNQQDFPSKMEISNLPDSFVLKESDWLKELINNGGENAIKILQKVVSEQIEGIDISKLIFPVDLAKHQKQENAIYVKGIKLPDFSFPEGLAKDQTITDLAHVIQIFMTKLAFISEKIGDLDIEIDVQPVIDILDDIYGFMTGFLSDVATETTLATRSSEATAIIIKGVLDVIESNTDSLDGILTNISNDTSNIDVLLSTRASETTLASILVALGGLAGLATEATLALIKAKTDNLDVALSTRASQATLALVKAKTDNLDVLLSTRLSGTAFTSRVGEVVVSPVANTILGRLKAIETLLTPISAKNFSYEDDDFVVGDSPIVLDVNTDLGKNSTKGYIANDGVGDFTLNLSQNGVDWGSDITMKKDEVLCLDSLDIDSMRITWIKNSGYRVIVW